MLLLFFVVVVRLVHVQIVVEELHAGSATCWLHIEQLLLLLLLTCHVAAVPPNVAHLEQQLSSRGGRIRADIGVVAIGAGAVVVLVLVNVQIAQEIAEHVRSQRSGIAAVGAAAAVGRGQFPNVLGIMPTPSSSAAATTRGGTR